METVLKDRKQLRRLFTIACNSFDKAENQLSCADKINKLKLIEEKALLMMACEEKFKQLLYSEETSDTEIEREVDEIESSLPEETLIAWERYRSAHRRVRETNTNDSDQNSTKIEKSDLEFILEFLQDEVESEERILLASRSFNASKPKAEVKYNKFSGDKKMSENKTRNVNFYEAPSATDLLTSSQVSKQCIFCSNAHYSGDCFKVRKMPLKQREEQSQQSHNCFLCLKTGHSVRDCNVRASCLCCGTKHRILLCRKMNPISESKDKESLEVDKRTDSSSEMDQALSNLSTNPNVVLQTFKVVIRGNGKKLFDLPIFIAIARLLIPVEDKASICPLSRSVNFLLFAIFTKITNTSKQRMRNMKIAALSQASTCNGCNVNIVDNCEDPIEILIGADVAGKLMIGGYREMSCGLVAIETKLGWSVMGRITDTARSECSSLLVKSMLSTAETITDLWSLDTLGITHPSVKKSQIELQEAAQMHFLNTVHLKSHRARKNLPRSDFTTQDTVNAKGCFLFLEVYHLTNQCVNQKVSAASFLLFPLEHCTGTPSRIWRGVEFSRESDSRQVAGIALLTSWRSTFEYVRNSYFV
ncbi:hypothetical protein HNY73_008116 [Argiope bruennichi]|uniref:CCHC-type domain-containing protein n=1 Tax=Argiope bruennichi TaxID=94029 RepID=A0A8T0F845_ARGBR|nr:hypothetical protein HNY73_008116 [Argiope bruennichi]